MDFTHGSDNCQIAYSAILFHMHKAAAYPTIRHVFGNCSLDGRMNDSNISLLESMMPASSQGPEVRAAMFDLMRDIMVRNAQEL